MYARGCEHARRQGNTPLLAAFGQRKHQRSVNYPDLTLYVQALTAFLDIVGRQTEDLALP
jgi:hypothetical protein